MVYNDYELVSTKRVATSRRRGGMLLRRQWDAMGGMPTLFTAGMCATLGRQFNVASAGYAPVTAPLATAAGARGLARNGLVMAGPALFGLCFGIYQFGRPSELKNLVRNCGTYSSEMRTIKNEHYAC